MADIKIEWAHHQNILYVKMFGHIDDETFLKFDSLIIQHLDNCNLAQVHVIFDNSAVTNIPTIAVFKRIQFTSHPRLGWGLSYGDTNLTRFFLKTLGRVNSVYFQISDSYAACLEFLQAIDSQFMLDQPAVAGV